MGTGAAASYLSALQSSPDGSTYTSVPGVLSATLSMKVATAMRTALGGGGHESRAYTLQEWELKANGVYVNGNVGQSNFLFSEGARCDYKGWLPNGDLIAQQGIVESYDLDVNESGLASWSTVIRGNGTPTITTGGTVPADTVVAATEAGYNGVLQLPGTAVTFAGEACQLVSGKQYQVTSTAHRLLDKTQIPTIKDNGATVADANLSVIDYLFGNVTFVAGYTPTTPITMDTPGAYLPLATITDTKAFKISVKNKLIDKTSFDSGGVKTYLRGLSSASGSITTMSLPSYVYGGGANKLTDILLSRLDVLLAFNLGVGNTGRFWATLDMDSKFNPANVQEQTLTWQSQAAGRSRDEIAWKWGS